MSRTTNRSSHSRQVAVTGAGTNGRPRQSLNPDQKSPSSSNSNDKKVVGHYVLGKTIGEGTFGKVRLAVHLPTGEKVRYNYTFCTVIVLILSRHMFEAAIINAVKCDCTKLFLISR